MRYWIAVVWLAGGLPWAGAQQGWERVQELRSNQAVKVYLRDGKVLRGKLQGAGSADLRLIHSHRTVAIDQSQIVRITRKSRLRGLLWGGIAGFGIAAPIGAYAGPYITDWGNPSAAVRMRHAAGWGLFFGGIGAGVGVLAGTEKILYRAP